MPKRLPLYILLGLFVIPFCAALIMLNLKNKPDFSTVEHGQLIQPPKNNEFAAVIDIGKPKWHIVYINPTPCDDSCLLQKNKLSKLHIALGAEQNRVSIANTPDRKALSGYKAGSIVIVDPNGFSIMRYAPGDNLSGLLKDMKRLLKYSHV